MACTSSWRTTSRCESVAMPMSFTPLSTSSASMRPDFLPAGRSICVTSPVMTIFEPMPMRVRNIFICSEVVFCASSRMMKASLSVRPRM